jgi:hypothetical protein
VSHSAEKVHSTRSIEFRLERFICRVIVENLCMIGEKPVQKPTAQIFLVEIPRRSRPNEPVDAVFAPRFA